MHPHSRRAVKAEEKKSVCSGSHNHLRIITATSCSLSTRPTIVSRVAENRVNPIFRTLVRDGHWGVEVENVNLSAPAPAGLQ